MNRVRPVEQVIEEDQQFKKTLSDCFSREGIDQQYLNSINSAGYHLSDIRKLVIRLNEHRTGKSIPRHRPGKLVGLDIFAGGALYTFPTPFNAKFSTNNRFAN